MEHAFDVELAPRDAGETFADVNIGERVAAALAARRIGRCETLVAVGRTSIELRRLSLPPAPPDDLPDMVRFQAMRDFAGMGDDWPLDYVPLDSAPAETPDAAGGTIGVLAAVIAPKLVEQIRATCEAAGLEPQRLVLRPFAAASLLRRARPSAECRLLVDLLAEEADLTVLIGEDVVFVRTVRLPLVEDEALVRAVLGETRRTVAAAQNQLGGRRVERVVVCGEPGRIETIQPQLEEQLALPVEPFDPFSAVELDGDLITGLPDRPGRFAPLLGMLLDEAAQTRHDIDFLNPRRRPAPPSQRRQYVLAGATAATLVLAVVFWFWHQMHSLDQDITRLQKDVKDLDKLVDAAKQIQAKTEDIDQFVLGDITWLDEIKNAAERLPPSERILVQRLSAGANPNGGGQMFLSGYAKEADDISDMVRQLGNASGKGGSANYQRPDYPWRFDSVVVNVPPPELGAAAEPAAFLRMAREQQDERRQKAVQCG
jgi:Tfp pilus assembly PilM family ATPase